MKCVGIKTFDADKLIFTPINDKSFQAGGISYGNIKYNYKTGADSLYLIIKDLKLTRNLIDKYKPKAEGGFHESEYCDQRYKAILSTKDLPELEKVIEQIDNGIKTFGGKSQNNSTLEYFVDNEGNPKVSYNTILKKPTMQAVKIYKDHNKEAKDMKPDEIKKKIGNKLKFTLKVAGFKDAKGKYQKTTGKDAKIECNVRQAEGVDLGNVKTNLDFFEKTFVVGAVVDINVKIASWWSSPSRCEYGAKCILNDITVKSLPKTGSKGLMNFVDDDGEDIFGGCKTVGESNEDEKTNTEEEVVKIVDNDEDDGGNTDDDIEKVVITAEPDEEESEEVKPAKKKGRRIVKKQQPEEDD